MQIGAHISAAGGVFNAPLNAAKIGAECYQFFSRSPQGGAAPKLTPEVVGLFKNNNQTFGITSTYIHAPYYINLASSNSRIYYGSIEVLRDELERGSLLGVGAMMFHIGSSKDLGQKEAIAKTVKAIKQILKGYRGSCQPLLEISAGSGNIIGDTFEEISEIIKKVGSKKIGVCFDTCHSFGAGYDFRTEKNYEALIDDFDSIIGLDNLYAIHINDSSGDLGAKLDRHEHIGKGKIGLKGFKLVFM